MGNSKYVGRVGGLAVALGVGAAIATAPGTACADETGTPPSTDASTATSDTTTSLTETPSTGSTDTSDPAGGDTGGATAAPKVTYDSSGGALTSDDDDGADTDAEDPAPAASEQPTGNSGGTSTTRTPPKKPKRSSLTIAPEPTKHEDAGSTMAGPKRTLSNQASESITVQPSVGRVSLQSVASMPSTDQQLSTVALSQSAPSTARAPKPDSPSVVSKFVSVGLGLPISGASDDLPDAPPESPVLLTMLAWSRNRSQESLVENDATDLRAAAEPMQSSLVAEKSSSGEPMLMAAALAANSAPTVPVQPTGIPDPVTGVVNGQVIASDADGNSLTYSVTGTSANGGTVSINPTTGAYTYTPTAAARLAAGTTDGADTDTFTVSVLDGQTTTTGTVPVYVLPTQLTTGTPITVGNQPAGVALYENAQDPTKNRTYVINQYDKTVSVIDANPNSTTYNKVISTIKLASTPSDIAISPDGTRAYVATKGNSSVAVINTTTNTVITNVRVGSTPVGVAVSPDGKKLYVTNGGSSTVSVISADTVNNIYKETSRITVGSQPSGIAVSPDGSKLYVTLRYSDSLAVVNLADNTKTLVKVGDSPREVALTPDGKRAFVTNYDATVSAINTDPTSGLNYLKEVARISTGGVKLQPVGVAISKDGSLAYVSNGKDTVSVFSTKTNTIIKTITIDTAAESGPHYVALSADGTRIYVTDFNDDNVRVLSLTRGNTAPVAIANPTVGSPDTTTGAVSGLVNLKDPDGDALTLSTVAGPSNGTVSYNAGTGTYTYTPNPAAQNPGATDTFTVRATDPAGAFKDATVTVPFSVAPPPPPPPTLPVTTTAITVGTYPVGTAFSGNHAYVLNQDSGTVTVIDTTNKQVVGQPIPVGYATGVVAHDQTVYVASVNWTGHDATILVIDATQNTVVDSFDVGPCGADCWHGPAELAISPDGSQLYLAREDGLMYIVDTATREASWIETPYGADIKVSPDGNFVYVTNSTCYSACSRADGDTVRVYAAGSGAAIADIHVGPGQFDQPRYVTVAPDGSRVYSSVRVRIVEPLSGGTSGELITDYQGMKWEVVDSYYMVSIIDTSSPSSPTYNQEIGTIRLYGGAADLAVSPDGKRLYVDQGDGKSVTVIDTTTNKVIGAFATDQNAATGVRSIAVAPNGSLYVTDAADGKVYVVTV